MNPYILNITGKPDSGKTTLAMFLLEYFRETATELPTVTHIAIEPMAALRKGIPKKWTDGRGRRHCPGLRADGGRSVCALPEPPGDCTHRCGLDRPGHGRDLPDPHLVKLSDLEGDFFELEDS